MRVPNTNSQTIHQMGQAINAVVRQATGRDAVQNIDMDFVTVAQNKTVQVFSESIPYMFRRTGGGMNIGNARLSRNKVIGGTLAWNQLEQNGKGDSITGWTARHGSVAQENGFIRVTATQDSPGMGLTGGDTGYHETGVISGHKYLIVAQVRKPTEGVFRFSYSGGAARNSISVPANVWSTIGVVWTYTEDIARGKLYLLTTASNEDAVDYRNVMSFDLTLMFGSVIADYIYSLDQTAVGSGMAWFKNLFPDAYYEYNAGELLSVSGLVSHDMTGFNQWDEEYEAGMIDPATGDKIESATAIVSKNYISVFPDTEYYFNIGNLGESWFRIAWYDGAEHFISGAQLTASGVVQTAPANARYLLFCTNESYGATYRNNICVNFSNPNLNGRYEPYHLYSYPLDSDLILRGIPKLDTDNNLYYDGDTYEPDGTVTRRYGIVDLGTLAWTKNGSDVTESGTRFDSPQISDIKQPSSGSTIANILCEAYTTESFNRLYNAYNNGLNKIIAIYSGEKYLCVYDSDKITSMTAEQFKAAMSGVYLVYELETPTTETADPFTDPQEVSPYGTEEYLSTGIVPVGNETQYLELSDTNM